ncbi:MAG: nucleotidyltransferase domain-containing protein [Clostridiales Family XIII bacterium]|jgi:predicted nucleotidyltransferase|nr:nucleotidyltransferase domain-containing protein [Clostridiales Family XIII bacterium]
MLDQTAVINTVAKYADAVTQHLSPSSIILFGSYAKGEAREDSDIDVAIVFDGFKGDWLKTSALLWSLCRGISYDIEPHLLDTTTDNSGFLGHVLKTGKVIYGSGVNRG